MLPGDDKEAEAVTHVPADVSPRKGRVAISFQLEVAGGDLEGRDFVCQARTSFVGRNGAAIVIDKVLAPEQGLTIKRVGSHQDAEVRVVGLIGSEAGDKVYGVAFLDPAANIWGIDFPTGDIDEVGAKVLLECPSCHTRQITPLNEVELSVFEAAKNLSRNCTRCRDVTLWKQSLYGVPPGPETASAPSLAASAQPKPAPAPKAIANRREHPRAKIDLKGCILFCGQETPVQVTDMSRGGIRFRSRRNFADGVLVRVAVPYTPGAANIFVAGRIRWCRRLPSGMSECGLKYVKE